MCLTFFTAPVNAKVCNRLMWCCRRQVHISCGKTLWSLGTCYDLHIHQFVEVLYFQVFEHLEVQSALLSVTIIDHEIVSMFLFHCTEIRSCMLESSIHKPMQKWQACLPQSKWCRISWSKQPILWSNSQGYKSTWMELHPAKTVSREWKAHIRLKQYDELYRGKAFMIFYDQASGDDTQFQ